MEFPPGRPPVPPQVLFATGHEWAVFLAPSPARGQYVDQEPYYFERHNQITTWIRPFDYIEPANDALAVGIAWQAAEQTRRHHEARKRARADTAVRQHHVKNTAWRRVETKQGRVYYYNNDTRESRWDQPREIAEAEQLAKEDHDEELVEGTEMNVDDAEWMLAQMQAEEEEAADAVDDQHSPEEALSDGEDSRLAGLAADERTALFKAMLRDAQINPFGTWDMEQHKLAGDWRLAAVADQATRQDLFDAACADAIARRNHESQNAPASNPSESTGDPFTDLLREKVTKRTSFARFCQRNLKDPRYLSIKTSREREKRFTKHLESLASS
ncbi:hypothetical protein H4S01_004525 [Coemansia sp. RSA 2610]|nr:hypothetical protein H4S01_004525 [Coemansia sp. RSA 2610]